MTTVKVYKVACTIVRFVADGREANPNDETYDTSTYQSTSKGDLDRWVEQNERYIREQEARFTLSGGPRHGEPIGYTYEYNTVTVTTEEG